MPAELSPLDSDRFGFPIYRARCATSDEVSTAITDSRAAGGELLILRFPCGADDILPLLSEWRGCRVADTLVHYERKTESPPVLRDMPGYAARLASLPDRTPVAALAGTLFGTYTSHYSANPRTNDAAKLSSGYAEWATSFIQEDTNARFCVLIERPEQGELAAFAGSERLSDMGHAVLFGVSEAHQKRGLYRQLIEHTIQQFAAQGCTRVQLSTQVQNVAVQKVWTRCGFELLTAEYTVHVDLREPPGA